MVDDLTPWQDSDIVRALTAPGEPEELADEQRMLTAFRAAAGRRSRRRGRVVGRIGLGMSTLVVVVGLGGGVAAAAYTSSLPTSIQDVAHALLGPVGVPAPPPVRHDAARHRPGLAHPAHPQPISSTSSPVAVPVSDPSPHPGAARAAVAPSPRLSTTARPHPSASATAAPAVAPTPTVSPSPSPSPTPTVAAPAGDPSTWTLTAAAARPSVRVHRGVRVDGQLLDAAGAPIADHRVTVWVHVAGTQGWQRAAVRRSAADGTAHAWLPDLTHDIGVVMRAGHGVHSAVARVVVRPVLTVTVALSDDGTSYVVTVAADGGDAGDQLKLLRRRSGSWRQVGAGYLDGTAQASFSVPVPRKQARYALRLPATRTHAAAWKAFTVAPPA